MKYNFKPEELHFIYDIFTRDAPFGPSSAYRWFNSIKPGAEVDTNDVEDFAIAFMSQYNKEIRMVF